MKTVSLTVLGLLLLASTAAPWIAPHEPVRQYRDNASEAPSRRFPMGTDEFGRDNWSRLLYAGRWSMLTAALATTVSIACGVLMGLLAAASGGWIENSILWLSDLTLSLPWLYVLFAVRGLLPLSIPAEQAMAGVVILIGLIGWAGPARLVRAAARASLDADYVKAARSFGAPALHIWRFHVLPSLRAILAPQVFVLAPRYVMAESALSFLGLGLGEPTPSWGSLLAGARTSMVSGLPWWSLAPVLPLMLMTLACSQLVEKELTKKEHSS
jgi:peptide/nickel transport system permease protein